MLAKLPKERERWHLSRILNKHPFDRELLSLTDVQITWILAQHELDHPELAVKRRYHAKVDELMGHG